MFDVPERCILCNEELFTIRLNSVVKDIYCTEKNTVNEVADSHFYCAIKNDKVDSFYINLGGMDIHGACYYTVYRNIIHGPDGDTIHIPFKQVNKSTTLSELKRFIKNRFMI